MPWVKSDHTKLLEENPHLKDFLPFLDELNRESDRGKVLVSTGYLEQLLEDTLRAFMLDVKSSAELFEGGNAALGTFSSRAKACHALGLISDDEIHDIELIRRIRNHFAHSMTASFEEDQVRTRCALLKHRAHDYGDVRMSAQGQFSTAATGLISNLVNRAAYVRERKLKFGNWPR